jgi:hypothetical protein
MAEAVAVSLVRQQKFNRAEDCLVASWWVDHHYRYVAERAEAARPLRYFCRNA